MEKSIFSRTTLADNQVEFCIVSDVHIATDGGRNDYVFNDNNEPLSGEAFTLKRFCECVKASGYSGQFYDNKHYLILLGDVVNGGECGYSGCYNSKAYKMLVSALEPWVNTTSNILYIPGNHDKSAKFHSHTAQFPRTSVIETIEEQTRKDRLFTKCGIIFEHGHKFDYLCSGKSLLGLTGDFASHIVVSLCPNNVEDILRGREFYYDNDSDNAIRPAPKSVGLKTMNREDRRVANGALKFLKEHPDCHTIVCGHTHQEPVSVSVRDNGRTLAYFNTGKFARDLWLNIVVEQDKDGTWRRI